MELKIRNKIIKTPILDIVKELKEECGKRGKYFFKDISIKHDYISVTCPYHKAGQENKPSASFYSSYSNIKIRPGTFNCFTCGETHTIEQVVSYCLGISEQKSKDWILNRFEGEEIEEVIYLPFIKLKEEKPTYLNESILDNFQSWHPYMAQRKLTPEICSLFKVKYDPVSECVVFPTWDEKGNLVMLTKRSINSKNFYLDKDVEKPIYLLNYIQEKGIDEVTVVESQINALTLWGYGIPAIATFGCNITSHQFDILNKSGIRHYYLAFDGDAAGRNGTIKFLKNIRNDVLVDIIKLPLGKDVNDLTEEEFNSLKIYNRFNWDS